MKLSFEQIQAITTGALRVFEDDGGIHFRRFREEQLETIHQRSEKHFIRASASAGCCLDFYTDSNNLVLAVVGGIKYEIYIDGAPTYFFTANGSRRFPVTLPEGRKRVTITMPNYSEGILEFLMLDEGAYVEPHKYQKHFLFHGDSITQGAQSTRDSNCYAYSLCRYFDVGIINRGIGGGVMHTDVLEAEPYDIDAVFIAYGTNDFSSSASAEVLLERCTSFFDGIRALYPDKKIFYISPLWRADGMLKRKCGTLDDCRKVFIPEAEKRGFIHLDGYRMIPHSPDYFGDGYLHPNDMGFALYAQNLAKEVGKYL